MDRLLLINMGNEGLVMYILINSDLKMREGRAMAQVGHIVHTVVDAISRDVYESLPMPEYCLRYLQWNYNPVMVILRASYLQLKELLELPETVPFYDNVDTGQELTGLGVFPRDPKSDSRYDFTNYKLY